MFFQTALICLLLETVSPLSHYLVLIPAEIRTDVRERVCVLNPYGEEGALLTLTISNEQTNGTILHEEHPLPKGHHCITFKVGEEEADSDYHTILAVSVHVQLGEAAHNETKKVVLRRYETLTFVQSDKVVYKPGQSVRFRIVSLSESFQPLDEKYPLVTIWDPAQNRIAQWREVQAKVGIAELTFQLTQKPPRGGYRIEVQKDRGKKEHYFSVEEYVLPTAELKVQMPQKITVLHRSINVRVCGRYTYGKPVNGELSGSVCYSGMTHFCHNIKNQTDPEGCVESELPTAPFRLKWASYYRVIEGSFTLIESGTDRAILGHGRTDVLTEITRITFQNPPKYYRPGMAFHGQIQLAYSTGSPVPNASIYIFNSATPGAQKLTTDRNGIALFSLKTQLDWDDILSFTAIYQGRYESFHYGTARVRHNSGQLDVRPFYSSTGSHLSIHPWDAEAACGSRLDLTIDYLVNGLPSDSQQPLTLYKLVLSKGIIVLLESMSVSVENGKEGHFSFPLSVGADLSPVAQILVLMVHPSGELIADRTDIEIAKCFQNKVSLRFSEEEELPKGRVSLEVGAGAESLCALRVVDQSVLLLKPERELTAESVYSLLPVQRPSGFPFPVFEPERSECDYPTIAFSNQDLGDVAQLLQDMGLKILTDWEYHRPVSCVRTEPAVPGVGVAYSRRVYALDSVSHMEPYTHARLGSSPRTAHDVRSYFPETWVWELVNVGAAGSRSVPLTVPDTITEWKGSAFCTGQDGFGISHSTSLNAFKPFFLELALPYSVVRTESFTLKAKVFNYLKECIMVKVSLLEADGFNTTGHPEDHQSCICSQEAHTFTWPLVAAELGKHNLTVEAESILSDSLCGNEVIIVPKKGAIDIVQKPLLVKAEGVETELTHSSFICPSGRTVSEKIHLHLPESVVQGSAWAYVTVQGDILGSAMENIDGLLRLPTGCGEQNMVKFAPNVYIQTYLNKTHQLTDRLLQKAVSYLRTGYQNQLTYRHQDGSFSAFGKHDPEGNTWLTAFVLKSFVKARPLVYIDDSVLREAVKFFLKNRLESGCFAQRGSLFNNAMKGGVDDLYSVCAYITSALLEFVKADSEGADSLYREWRKSSTSSYHLDASSSSIEETEPTTHSPTIKENLTFREGVITRALSSLASEIESVNSTYTLSLLAYTFTLAGDRDIRASLLEKLWKRAQEGGGLTHWQREDTDEDEEEHGFWWRAPSAEVEMTSYVLLALLSGAEVTKSELDQAVPIVSWLVRQQNSYGGFASTQDTVIALQALSLYAELTFAPQADSSVSISSPSGSLTSFHVDSQNKLLLQRHSLPDVPGDYTVEVTGTSCLLLQSTLHYNIPPAQKDPAFNITASLFHPAESEYFLTIALTFTGERPTSNMVILDVAMLSGFSAQEDSFLFSKDSSNVSRSEMQDGHLVLYLSPMERDRPVHLSVKISPDFHVENLRPAVVKAYDYYKMEDSVVTLYEPVEPKVRAPVESR